MKNLLILTFAVTLWGIVSWSVGAPPQVQANRGGRTKIEPANPPTTPQPIPVSGAQLLTVLDDTPVQAPPPVVSRKPATADDVLKLSREMVAQYSSIRARIVESVSIGARSFKAEGHYLQRGLKDNDWRLKLELTLKIGQTEASLLEICDGDVLWTRHQINSGKRKLPKEVGEHANDPVITRRNLRQILDTVRNNNSVPENLIIADLGLGGLPALLGSLDQSLDFTAIKEDTLRSQPVYVVQGTWTDTMLARWQGKATAERDGKPLAEYIPDQVRVYVAQKTGFPLRLLYLKKLSGRNFRPMLMLDFIDVAINQPVDKSEFEFVVPDKPPPLDMTYEYLMQIQPGTPVTPPAGLATPPAAPATP